MLKAVGTTAIFTPLAGKAAPPGSRDEGPETPKISLEISGSLAAGGLNEAGMRRIKQLGIDHVFSGGPGIPWEESQIRDLMDRLKSGGLTLGNLMIG